MLFGGPSFDSFFNYNGGDSEAFKMICGDASICYTLIGKQANFKKTKQLKITKNDIKKVNNKAPLYQ